MMLTPFPHQLTGALFLANNRFGLLADAPRVGKTGAAIIAADYNLANTILVITTASGRSVWRKGFADWSVMGRSLQVITSKDTKLSAQVVIVGWPSLANPKIRALLLARKWDLLISDEDHFAKSFTAKRTQALYGTLLDGGRHLDNIRALYACAAQVWPLTGTPLPHSPADMYPRVRALSPDRLLADSTRGWPDVTKYDDFLHRYCVVRMKKLSNFNRIPVVIGGRNLPELKARLEGFILRRTQQDVGIREPIYDLLPLAISAAQRRQCEANVDKAAVLAAAADGRTKELEMHLGSLRRVTGTIKAHAVVDAVIDEFDCGLDKIVLAYWHKDVGKILLDGLAQYGVTGIDGSTPDASRGRNVAAFANDTKCRVFLAQIEAAGEAIDLSASAVLWFVETTFSPRAQKQMSLRITNLQQKRQAFVKVCTLEGSIDEALQASLMRLWTAIRQVLS
jgi:SWI/SNF-related matrix-associated actin-dependent regulator 1 of chromatin subfamily A